MQRGKNRVDHQHLLVKQLLHKIKKNNSFIKQRLLEKNIDYYHVDSQTRKNVIHQVISEFKETEEGHILMQSLTSQIKQQVEQVTTSSVKKEAYLIDCFRQATAFPLIKEREQPMFNLKILHGKQIKKQLRRVIWSRIFNIDRFRMAFSKWDREVTPYKIKEELSVSLQKASVTQKITLKDNQVDTSLRIIEYFLKSHGRLPQKYHFFITLLITDLYSFIKVERVMELGAVALGVVNLLQYYNQETNLKIQNIKKILKIIDIQSFNFIQTNYLSGSQAEKTQRDLLQGFEMFRLTAGSYYLPLQTGQFIVDQLIIRKKCRLDMYSMFAIMILILSDQLQEEFPKGKSLKEILQMSREVIKKQQFAEAYNVIYEDVPAMFSADDLAKHPNNKLLTVMLTYQKQSDAHSQIDETDFVVDLDKIVRIGNKK